MILVLGIAAGFLAGLARSWISGKPYQLPQFAHAWLVVAAVLPQLLIFQIPATSGWFSDAWASAVLIGSQLILLAFLWLNRHHGGVWILGVGVALNLLVISLNGGLMPISPETLRDLFPSVPMGNWQIGSRPGRSKNIILPFEDTRLAWLSDSILLPDWFPWTRALSPGDLVIVLGVIWILAVAAPRSDPQEAPAHPT